jgi:hypothetical protein
VERLIAFVIAVVVYLIYRAVRGSNRGSEAPQTASYTGKSYPFSEILPDPKFPQVRSIRSKIRGVTKRNADRSDRQRIIRQSLTATLFKCGESYVRTCPTRLGSASS